MDNDLPESIELPAIMYLTLASLIYQKPNVKVWICGSLDNRS